MKTSTRTRTYEVRIILVNTCDEESRTRHHCDDWTIIINFLKFIYFIFVLYYYRTILYINIFKNKQSGAEVSVMGS
jgi:hypothetical protein